MKKYFFLSALALTVMACGHRSSEEGTALPVNTIERTSEGIRLNKNVYTYDANGNITEQIRYDWNNRTDEWQLAIRYQNTYDANGNKLSQILSTYTDSVNTINSSKFEASYNAQNQPVSEKWYAWDTDRNDWVECAKYDYTYNAEGYRTQELNQVYNRETAQWENCLKIDYVPDGKNHSSAVTKYEWVDEAWVARNSDIFTYDKQGNQIAALYQAQDSTGQWQPFCRKEFTYDDENRLLDEKTYQMASDSTWHNMVKISYAYDAQGNKRSATTYNAQGTGWRTARSLVYDNNYDAEE